MNQNWITLEGVIILVGCGGKTTGVSGGACGFGAGIFLVSKSLGLLAQPPMISFATKLGELRDWTADDEREASHVQTFFVYWI